MTYTPHRPPIAESPDQLRARIPGWGVDSDPADRPSVPKLKFQEDLTGAHWEFPDRQPEKWPRERSIEHKFLTPVFGTAQPPKGLSGVLRRFSSLNRASQRIPGHVAQSPAGAELSFASCPSDLVHVERAQGRRFEACGQAS